MSEIEYTIVFNRCDQRIMSEIEYTIVFNRCDQRIMSEIQYTIVFKRKLNVLYSIRFFSRHLINGAFHFWNVLSI